MAMSARYNLQAGFNGSLMRNVIVRISKRPISSRVNWGKNLKLKSKPWSR